MSASRKPNKKVLIQFAIALVVAAALGLGAVVVGFTLITSLSGQAEQAKKDAQQKADQLAAELEKVKNKQTSDAPRTYKVVQAQLDIQPGQPITREMVTLVESDERPLPGTLSMMSQAVGKMVKSPILRGEALDMSRMIDASGYINVQAGKRAITIQVDSVGGLSGSLAPGARVDVLTTLTNEGKTITRTLLQNIQVIAVGDGGGGGGSSSLGGAARSLGAAAGSAPKAASGNGTVTLVVTPKEAEMLSLANELGSFHLTLRNFQDKQLARNATGTDMTELMTGVDPTALKKSLPARPRVPAADGFHNVNYSPDAGLPAPGEGTAGKSKYSMQIYRGTGSETVDFQQ